MGVDATLRFDTNPSPFDWRFVSDAAILELIAARSTSTMIGYQVPIGIVEYI